MQFDWYKLSLLNEEKPDLQKFQSIIRNAQIQRGIERVPTSYRKKLLVLFQSLSSKMKYETKCMQSVNQSLNFKKNAVADRLQNMEKGLQESKQQLIRMKSAVSQKKKMAKKLSQKIQTLRKNKTQQTYFCPFCSRNDFASKQIFTFHMFSEHQTYKSQQQNNLKLSMPNNSFSSSVHNELKDFIMTLKDKEMEMMKMILSQKKQFETQDLERLYARQMNIMTMKNKSEPQYLTKNKYSLSQQLNNDYEGEDVDLGTDGQQIHGQSQFLFYQKSEKYKQAAEKQEYSLQKALEDRKKQLNRHPYYDVFKDMEENKSLNIEAHRLDEQNSKRKVFPTEDYQQEEYGESSNRNTDFKILSKFNLVSNGEILSEQKPPVQPLKMTSNNLKFQQFTPSITDRLKQQQKKTQNNSIYSGFGKKTATKGFSMEQEYVFNSGPLIDDNGGHSDYEDYFGEQTQKKEQPKPSQIFRPQQNDTINFSVSKETYPNVSNQFAPKTEESLIEDEQIKLNPGSYSFVSKSSFSKQQISQLLSPDKGQMNTSRLQDSKDVKDKYNMYYNMHEKSSQIVDLSDSFSRRDFQLSKDQSSINLSDLKLSKLQKKRAEERQKQKLQPKSNSPTYGKASKEENSEIQGNINKKNIQFVLVSEQKPFNLQRSNNDEQKIDLLTEFEKKIDTPKPLLPESYSFQKKETYQFNEFYRQPPQNTMEKNYLYQGSNRPSKLNDFIRSEYSRNQNLSPNSEAVQQQRALSPHEFFAKQMRKQSSYGSFQQNQSSKNNPQSYVSQSSQSRPPIVDLKEYQKPPMSQIKRQDSRNSETNKFSEQSSQRSQVRGKKRFQRHEELEVNGNQDVLNEFFKKQFQGESRQSASSGNYLTSQDVGNRGSYESSGIGSSKRQDSKSNSQSYSQSVSQQQESSALDEFIK